MKSAEPIRCFSGFILRAIPFLSSLILFTPVALAIDVTAVTFYQMDFWSGTPREILDSEWGDARFTLVANGITDANYLNLVIRADALASPQWVIRNMGLPVNMDLGSPLELSRFINLEYIGILRGMDLTSLDYALVVSPAILTVQPSPGVFTTVSVISDNFDTQGLNDESGTLPDPTDPGPPPLEESPPTWGMSKVGGKKLNDDYPDKEEGKNECGPTAVLRGLRWLESKGAADLGPVLDDEIKNKVKTGSGWSQNGGVPAIANFLVGKMKAAEGTGVATKLKGPARIKVHSTSAYGVAVNRGGPPTFKWIKAEINAGEAIELLFYYRAGPLKNKGHVVNVIGYDDTGGKQDIIIQDDLNQGKPNDRNRKRVTGYMDGSPPKMTNMIANNIEFVVSQSPEIPLTVTTSPSGHDTVRAGELPSGVPSGDSRRDAKASIADGDSICFYWTIGKNNYTNKLARHPEYAKYQWKNTTGKTRYIVFAPPKDPTITDWYSKVIKPNGRRPTLRAGKIKTTKAAALDLLIAMPLEPLRIPWFSHVSGPDSMVIYTAIDLNRYLRYNPNGPFSGYWTPGQSLGELGLTVIGGVIPGVEGLYLATSDFTFDSNAPTGFVPEGAGTWLESVDFENLYGPITLASEVGFSYGDSGYEEPIRPQRPWLGENAPNPFNPNTTINFGLPANLAVNLVIHDLRGRIVKILLSDTDMSSGPHSIIWDGLDEAGRAAPSGTYFFRLSSGNHVETGRMTLLR